MTNEKKIKAIEEKGTLLIDEQLSQVTGGNYVASDCHHRSSFAIKSMYDPVEAGQHECGPCCVHYGNPEHPCKLD